MDGHLTIGEFFDLIKYFTVFNIYAGDSYKQNPWMINNTDFYKNNDKIIKDKVVVGFPNVTEKLCLASIGFMTSIAEVNFKQFLIQLKYLDTLRPMEVPMTQNSVPLVNLIVTLTRWDIKIVNPKLFLALTSERDPRDSAKVVYK